MTHLDHILIQLFICHVKNNFLKYEFNFMAWSLISPTAIVVVTFVFKKHEIYSMYSFTQILNRRKCFSVLATKCQRKGLRIHKEINIPILLLIIQFIARFNKWLHLKQNFGKRNFSIHFIFLCYDNTYFPPGLFLIFQLLRSSPFIFLRHLPIPFPPLFSLTSLFTHQSGRIYVTGVHMLKL